MPNHYDLLHLLADMENSWQLIGLALGVSCDSLDGLSRSHETSMTKLSKVISEWMNSHSSPVTWETMISTIEGPIVNNKKKAVEIRHYLGKLIIIIKLIVMLGTIYDTILV